MICKKCGGNHHISYHLADQLKDKGFPTHEKGYKAAHRKANEAEKKEFGKKSFKEIDKIDRSLGKHELSGKNSKSGKISVSRKVPVRYRSEVAKHELAENRILRKKKNG